MVEDLQKRVDQHKMQFQSQVPTFFQMLDEMCTSVYGHSSYFLPFYYNLCVKMNTVEGIVQTIRQTFRAVSNV